MNKKIFSTLAIILAIAFFSFNFGYAKAQNEKGLGRAPQAQERNQAQNSVKENKDQAQKHRSEAAEFVLNLLHVAEREPGRIGEQVRVIAREQNEATEKIAEKLDRVEKRNKIKTFFAGSDYKNLGQLRSEMVHVRNRLEKLNRLMENMEEGADKTEIQNQIKAMEQERTRIENFIKTNEDKFSLFGWFARLFNKNK